MLRFAYSTINWGTTPDMDTTLGEIASAGWKAVELFWHELNWLGPHTRVQGQLAQAGLQAATTFGVASLPTSDTQLQSLMRQVEYASLLGASHYGLIGGTRLRQRNPTNEEYRDLATFCDRLAEYGASLGVDVAYHPHTACTIETEAEIDILLELTTRLTLCLDASHIAVVDEDPVAHLRKYQSRTSYVHLKDWARGAFTEMGRGTLNIDFAAFLQELERQNFGGWVVVEQSRSDVSPAESCRTNAAYLRSIGYDPGSTGGAA